MLDPTPELPDDTSTERVRFPSRIRNALTDAGLKTVGDIREMSDDTLLSFPDIGNESVTYIRETLGLPSTLSACATIRRRAGLLAEKPFTGLWSTVDTKTGSRFCMK